MPPHPSTRALTLALLAAACAGADHAPAVDTARPREPAPAASEPPQARVSGWNDAAGALMIVADSAPDAAIVVVPDATEDAIARGPAEVEGARGILLDLFSRAGAVGEARVESVRVSPAVANGDSASPPADDACTAWPSASLRFAGAPTAWTFAFPAGRATAVPLDSVESWPPADSARAVATIARIASAIPGDTAAAFRGLPFLVRGLWRLRDGDAELLVARVVRRLGQEANPREQHLLLVAERDAAGAWVPAFVERTSGPEETVETFEVLGAASLGRPPLLTLVLSRDTDAGGVFVLLERRGARRWRVRWTSAYAGC